MKTKSIAILSFSLLIIFISCKKECDDLSPVCSEAAPTDEVCDAVFQRWFFDESANTCQLIVYSGCKQWGFASKEECFECKCK